MTSVLSLCHTTMALSMGVLSGGPSLLPLAVNVTCHMPTIDANGSSTSVKYARPDCTFHDAGCACFPAPTCEMLPQAALALAATNNRLTTAAIVNALRDSRLSHPGLPKGRVSLFLMRSRWCGGAEVAVSPAEDVIRFGVFELDLKASQLTRYGTKLRLPQQPMQLLAVLLERPGEIFTRDELRGRLWSSDVFVDFDHGLNKSIQKLRDALGDSAASPRYIEAIPGVGYRFIAPVSNGHRPPAAKVTIEPSIQLPDRAAEGLAAVVAGGHKARWWIATPAVVACAAIGIAVYVSSRHPAVITYTQLTDFTDSASDPALSPDGHILAFIRGDSYFVAADPIYVKMLPSGEARMLTNDPRPKYGLAFSPDGSQIAYTVMGGSVFATYAVSVFGGNPHLLLDNAAGLTWLDPEHWLFSRLRSGLHLGIVTSGVAGDHLREVYYPPHERAMAHYAYASPDRRSALVVEMDGQGEFTLCKLVSLEGDSRALSPKLRCHRNFVAFLPHNQQRLSRQIELNS
jgi:DNA-binding winged helix-turn-helix (wHTH) protein